MADFTLQIAGRAYAVSARGGEEPHLRKLEALIAHYADAARRAAGTLSGERTLLYLVLILADALDEAQHQHMPAPSATLLERIADRLEAVATALEEAGELS